jgi:membrane-associated phospholipid phosphatase
MRKLLQHYTFVDYATQIYSLVVAVLILCFHNSTVRIWPWLLAGHAAGLILIHSLIQGAAARPGNRLLAFLRLFYPVLFFTPFFCETGQINRMFFSGFLDEWTIRADQALLGFQPGVDLMVKMPWLPLSELLYFSYFCYYLMVLGVGLALFLKSRREFVHYVSVVSFLFYICYLLYILLPIVGPQVLLGEIPEFVIPPDLQHLANLHAYPEAVQAGPFSHLMAWIYRTFEAPGAAWPSSHVAVALCTVCFSWRYLRPIRYLHLAMALLLCFSTLYCHYHYGVDVLGGLLTALILVPLGNRLYVRYSGAEHPQADLKPINEGKFNPKRST